MLDFDIAQVLVILACPGVYHGARKCSSCRAHVRVGVRLRPGLGARQVGDRVRSRLCAWIVARDGSTILGARLVTCRGARHWPRRTRASNGACIFCSS